MAESRTLDMKPLPVYSGTLSAWEWGKIKTAKESLGLPFLVQPAVAVAGTSERVLAIGIVPPFICDYALVPDTESPGLAAALEWVLTDKVDLRAVLSEQMLSIALKTEVKEVTNALGQTDPLRDDERPFREHTRDREPEAGSVVAGRRSVSDSD